MVEFLNFSKLYIKTHDEYINKYKNNNGKIKKHTTQIRYLALNEFCRSHVYWSRFNLDSIQMDINEQNNINYKNIYKKDKISGKYLNELHNFFIKHNFYNTLYTNTLIEYLNYTNFKTLKSISIDSFFVRNILGRDLRRNTHYNNKSGLKVHALVDSKGVVLSIYISEGVVNDSITINKLLNNLLIKKELLSPHIDEFLADSAYSSINNIYDLTSYGFNVIMGRNKQHIKKTDNIDSATNTQIKGYKKRGIIENTFGHVQRYPILLNNYESDCKSYQGLLFFVLACSLSKRLNMEIKKDNDIEFKKEQDRKTLIKIQESRERKEYLYKVRKIKKENKEKMDKERKIKSLKI